MQPSLLRLDRIVFQKVRVEATPNPILNAECEINSCVNVYRNQDDITKWKVQLTLTLAGQNAPYTGEITAVGEYTVRGEQSEEASLNLVHVNGPAILYSAIREMVVNITGRGPHPAVLLPSITFIDRKQKKASDSAKPVEPTVPSTEPTTKEN